MAYARKIKLIVAYDGTRYHGWQFQSNKPSIQAVLEEKIEIMTCEPVRVIGSGRTDAGVHALGQACHFETTSSLAPGVFQKGLNSLLPHDILVIAARTVQSDFHARYSATSKVYEYRILNRPQPDVFLRHYAWHISRPLDLNAIRRCLGYLLGEQDFTSFRSTGSNNKNPVRRMLKADLPDPENDIVRLVFEADGFLRHMVRSMVGTLADVGTHKITEDGFLDILRAKNRQRAGRKAPPGGLFLVRVNYENETGQAAGMPFPNEDEELD